jgi:hypothetical protein
MSAFTKVEMYDEGLRVFVPGVHKFLGRLFGSGTLRKLPRRIALSVNSRNQQLDQLQPAGTGRNKWTKTGMQRGKRQL